MIFFNVGWMRKYKGVSGDNIVGGGSFVQEKGYGHEIFNFLPEKNNMYGYVQPKMPHNTIKLERLGASSYSQEIDEILVVWVAKSPTGGVYIVGWYKNSTVYRHSQKISKKSSRYYKNENFGYYAKANISECTLLSVDARTFKIPRGSGGMGQSNVWYADKNEHLDFKKKVLEYIYSGVLDKLALKSKNRTKQTDPYIRQKIETAAIEATIRYYEKLGYDVNSVEKDNVGWDIEATLENNKLLIEVKGLSGSQLIVELTPNEYKKMNKNKYQYRVSVLTNALSSQSILSIFSYSPESNRWEDEQDRFIKIEEIVSARLIQKQIDI